MKEVRLRYTGKRPFVFRDQKGKHRLTPRQEFTTDEYAHTDLLTMGVPVKELTDATEPTP